MEDRQGSRDTGIPALHPGRVLFSAVLVVLALQILFAFADRSRLEDGGLLGPDSYMRSLRVLELYQGGRWYDPVSERTNAPYGETLHWGRPLDAVLTAGAILAAPFTPDAHAAVLAAAFAVGPLIALLMIPAWSWATRPFLGNGPFLMILVLTGLTPFLVTNMRIGRADHHGMLALLFLLQLGAAIRLATTNGNGDGRVALLLGVAGGLSVWASIMAMIAQLLFAGALALRYLRRDSPTTREICLYTAALAVTLTVALAMERPPSEWLTADFRRLSIVHWTLAAAAAATWSLIRTLERKRPEETAQRVRIVTLLLGGGVPLAVMAVLFPKFFLGPAAGYDPESVRFYLTSVAEFQPLFPVTAVAVPKFILNLGPVLIGLGFILYDYRGAAPGRRAVYDILLIGMAIYLPLALRVGRFAIEAEVLALAPWAMALARIMTWSRTVRMGGRDIPLRGCAVVAATIGPLILWAMVYPLTVDHPQRQDSSQRDWAAMGTFLAAHAGAAGTAEKGGEILFTYFLRGPEIAWRTPYRVVGAPYGNIDALRDTRRIFEAATDAQAKRVIDRRGIGLLLYRRAEIDNSFFREARNGSFLSRIENGHVPDWLSAISLPDGLSSRFRLYRVTGAR